VIDVFRLFIVNLYGIESPSKYAALLAPRFPFTHWFAFESQPLLLSDGDGSFAH
jgi:hypothetical protein